MSEWDGKSGVGTGWRFSGFHGAQGHRATDWGVFENMWSLIGGCGGVVDTNFEEFCGLLVGFLSFHQWRRWVGGRPLH